MSDMWLSGVIDDIPTIQADHNGWIWTVGASGWAHLDTSAKPRRRNIQYPGFLLRKRDGLWGEVGSAKIYPKISATLEAAYQRLIADVP